MYFNVTCKYSIPLNQLLLKEPSNSLLPRPKDIIPFSLHASFLQITTANHFLTEYSLAFISTAPQFPDFLPYSLFVLFMSHLQTQSSLPVIEIQNCTKLDLRTCLPLQSFSHPSTTLSSVSKRTPKSIFLALTCSLNLRLTYLTSHDRSIQILKLPSTYQM